MNQEIFDLQDCVDALRGHMSDHDYVKTSNTIKRVYEIVQKPGVCLSRAELEKLQWEQARPCSCTHYTRDYSDLDAAVKAYKPSGVSCTSNPKCYEAWVYEEVCEILSNVRTGKRCTDGQICSTINCLKYLYPWANQARKALQEALDTPCSCSDHLTFDYSDIDATLWSMDASRYAGVTREDMWNKIMDAPRDSCEEARAFEYACFVLQFPSNLYTVPKCFDAYPWAEEMERRMETYLRVRRQWRDVLKRY